MGDPETPKQHKSTRGHWDCTGPRVFYWRFAREGDEPHADRCPPALPEGGVPLPAPYRGHPSAAGRRHRGPGRRSSGKAKVLAVSLRPPGTGDRRSDLTLTAGGEAPPSARLRTPLWEREPEAVSEPGWKCAPLTPQLPALRRLRQEDRRPFQASLGAQRDPVPGKPLRERKKRERTGCRFFLGGLLSRPPTSLWEGGVQCQHRSPGGSRGRRPAQDGAPCRTPALSREARPLTWAARGRPRVCPPSTPARGPGRGAAAGRAAAGGPPGCILGTGRAAEWGHLPLPAPGPARFPAGSRDRGGVYLGGPQGGRGSPPKEVPGRPWHSDSAGFRRGFSVGGA